MIGIFNTSLLGELIRWCDLPTLFKLISTHRQLTEEFVWNNFDTLRLQELDAPRQQHFLNRILNRKYGLKRLKHLHWSDSEHPEAVSSPTSLLTPLLIAVGSQLESLSLSCSQISKEQAEACVNALNPTKLRHLQLFGRNHLFKQLFSSINWNVMSHLGFEAELSTIGPLSSQFTSLTSLEILIDEDADIEDEWNLSDDDNSDQKENSFEFESVWEFLPAFVRRNPMLSRLHLLTPQRNALLQLLERLGTSATDANYLFNSIESLEQRLLPLDKLMCDHNNLLHAVLQANLSDAHFDSNNYFEIFKRTLLRWHPWEAINALDKLTQLSLSRRWCHAAATALDTITHHILRMNQEGAQGNADLVFWIPFRVGTVWNTCSCALMKRFWWENSKKYLHTASKTFLVENFQQISLNFFSFCLEDKATVTRINLFQRILFDPRITPTLRDEQLSLQMMLHDEFDPTLVRAAPALLVFARLAMQHPSPSQYLIKRLIVLLLEAKSAGIIASFPPLPNFRAGWVFLPNHDSERIQLRSLFLSVFLCSSSYINSSFIAEIYSTSGGSFQEIEELWGCLDSCAYDNAKCQVGESLWRALPLMLNDSTADRRDEVIRTVYDLSPSALEDIHRLSGIPISSLNLISKEKQTV